MKKLLLILAPLVLLLSGCATKKDEHVYIPLHNICTAPKVLVHLGYVRSNVQNELYITASEALDVLKSAIEDSRCFSIDEDNPSGKVANLDLLYSSKITRDHSPEGIFGEVSKLFLSVDAAVSIEDRTGRKTYRSTSLIEIQNTKFLGIGEDPQPFEKERTRAIEIAIRNAIKDASRAL
ncbi:MAG: hypothetical protein ACTTH5_06450 [Wolinella sp.]